MINSANMQRAYSPSIIETTPSHEVFVLFQQLVQTKLGIHLSKQKRLMLGHRLSMYYQLNGKLYELSEYPSC